MMKLFLLTIALLYTILVIACGSSAPANAGSNANTNSNAVIKIDPANMPDGLKPEPIQPSANSTPGIPPVIANVPKGATPTPGIPDPASLKKGLKPGVTPTPGIPSPEEIRKALGQKPTNVNVPPPASDQMMMKKNTNKIQKP